LIIQLSLNVGLIVIFAWCKYTHSNLLVSGFVLLNYQLTEDICFFVINLYKINTLR
jgi:hypothetical protein